MRVTLVISSIPVAAEKYAKDPEKYLEWVAAMSIPKSLDEKLAAEIAAKQQPAFDPNKATVAEFRIQLDDLPLAAITELEDYVAKQINERRPHVIITAADIQWVVEWYQSHYKGPKYIDLSRSGSSGYFMPSLSPQMLLAQLRFSCAHVLTIETDRKPA